MMMRAWQPVHLAGVLSGLYLPYAFFHSMTSAHLRREMARR